MKIRSVVSAEKILIEIALCVHVVVWHISLNIFGRTGLNFAIFSPYESALRANDGSVPYFSICQGTLPWHPNNVAEMKADTTCILCTFARWKDGFVLLRLATNATISCKILEKIGLEVSENSLTNGTCVAL